MNTLLLSNILDVTTIFICLFVTARVFFVYPRVRSLRLVILGLSMSILTMTSIVDLLSSNIENLQAQTDWFLYIGEAVALLAIQFSLLKDADVYLQRLLRIQVFASVLLVCLLLFSAALPDLPNAVTRELVSSLRVIACVGICFSYLSGFMRKHTRFGFMMSACFLLLIVGYLMDSQQYIVPLYAEVFDATGDLCRLGGFVALLAAVVFG